QRNQVVVPLNDRPIQFDMTTLALSFGFDRVSTAWDGELSQVIEQAKLAMLGTALDDLEATLDAMQQAVPDTETATFAAARSNRGWDAALKAVYSDNTILRDAAGQWMSAGTAELYAEDAFLGELAADDTDPLRAFLTLSKVAGYEPASAGFPSMAAASWSADSQDTLLVSSDLLWSPSKLLSVLAIAPALEQGSSQSVSQALAAELDCGLFAETLVDTGQPLGELYSGCGLSCAVTACRDGVALMWQRASEVSDQAQPLFALSSTGAATVGDEAEIVSLLGSWVARFAAENEAATATGPLKGDAIP
ncbi:MAG TPA: hypothetical protein VGP93_16070, partial [Polyangiaceae bacterium]|nr:hypothetical protein [Polyangiaceae bacterium]